jgi:hypothetical protein
MKPSIIGLLEIVSLALFLSTMVIVVGMAAGVL